MLPVRSLTAIALAFLVAGRVHLEAQSAISSRALTNRHIAAANDASAIGWDPAMLGVSPEGYELLIGLPYLNIGADGNKSLSAVNAPDFFFAKLGPIGAGISRPLATDSLSDALGLVRTNYYLGFGFAVAQNSWVGAGFRADNGEGFFGNAVYTLSAVERPMRQLLLSLVADDFTRIGDGHMRLDLLGAYRPLEAISLLGNMSYQGSDTAGGGSPVRLALGIAAGVPGFPVQANLNYEVTRHAWRFGLEFNTSSSGTAFGVGTFIDTDTSGLAAATFVARYSSIEENPIGPGDDIPTGVVARNPNGWAPNRAYTPAGLFYRHLTNDAQASSDALIRPCDGSGLEFDAPDRLLSLLPLASKTYAPLTQRLNELAPNPADLYKRIRQEYYTTTIRNRELMRGDSLQLVTSQGYSIGVQSVDQSLFPEVSVIVQVTDAVGRNVHGLGLNDFAFRDNQLSIKSVRPLDSTFNVPVDIVIILDCSGSMREEIQSVRTNVESFVNTMQARGADYRIGGVMYGSMIYDTLHPTSDLTTFKRFVANADAIGHDEITTLAIKAATEMQFRPGAQRLFLLITDDWQVQDNAALGEPDVVDMLWNTGARLYTIGNPCSNNGAVMTRLSLGREYNVKEPFNSILDDIGNDVTTLYQIVYDSKVRSEQTTMLRGQVRDETGQPAAAPIVLKGRDGAAHRVEPNPTTGEYETEIAEGTSYHVDINGGRYVPFSDDVDLTATRHGDTVVHNFTLRLPPTMLAGTVTDEAGHPVVADVRVEDANSGERVNNIRSTPDGHYEMPIAEGRVYRITAINPQYIPTAADLDARGTERGTKLTQDLKVSSIDWAIANGTTFKVKNIFFDVGRWDIKPESSVELGRVVELLSEYPTINVEIGAHTDAVGSDHDNQALSENRARSVVEYLIGKGVAAVRLHSRGYGESLPVAGNDTDDGRALNRRVEFKLVK